METTSRRYGWSGFTNTKEWATSLASTPKLLMKRGAYVRDGEAQLAEKEASGAQLAKVLNWFHVAMLGIGMIVGAGVFVSTGVAANELAGPAIVISFIIAGLSALLSALCYSEFSVQYPLAGGAYNFISLTLGEFTAWLVVTTLVLEYVLANAAVARSFSSYFATLIGQPPHFFTFDYKDYTVDFMAAGLMVACCILLMFTTAGGSWFNIIITGSQLIVILIVLILGFWKADVNNLKNFTPFGVQGIFDGAAFVFFSFIGYDCVSTLAEEVKRPSVDMPVGIVGCISFVSVVYTLMALCLVMMVPYDQLDTKASFATAFTQVGLPWAQYLVALGATLGIVTGVLVGVMGVARIVCSMGRTHLFFPVFGKVSPRFGTPLYATLFVTIAALPLCILTDLPALIDMVSAGTLAVFAVVSLALLWKRVIKRGAGFKGNAKPVSMILLLVALSVAFACCYSLIEHGSTGQAAGLGVTGGLVLLVCVVMKFTCEQHDRPSYRVPLFPFLPAASLLLNCFLMASLSANAYIQLAIFLAVVSIFYVFYGVHASERFEQSESAPDSIVGQKAIDLEWAHKPGEPSPASFISSTGAPGTTAVSATGPSAEGTERRGSLIDVMRRMSGTGILPEGAVGPRLGRFSGGVAYLPPPTLT